MDLLHDIIPQASKHLITPSKVELKLKKQVDGLKWDVLEGEGPDAAMARKESLLKAPAYPSSAKKPVNWGSVEKNIEDDKPEGEQALNALFKQIFKDGTDETRKAMMKSFTESGGTCLSTNWNEVGQGKVDVRPPDGMEAKHYEI